MVKKWYRSEEMDKSRYWWERATQFVVVLWVVCCLRLLIADVWDETNGMLAFSGAAMTLGQKLVFVLTEPLGFWRPLPTLVDATVLHFVRGYDLSWRLLRVFNMALLVAALMVFQRTLDLIGYRRFVFSVAFLFSGSAVITAGWYVNVFDAWVILILAVALALLFRGFDLQAGLLIGVAFFCKESAALAIPFLIVLYAAGRITRHQALRTGLPALILGLGYFGLRSLFVQFGGEGDIHRFDLHLFLPSLINLGESFWEQTLKQPSMIGFLWLALSLAALRKPRLIGASVLLLFSTAVVYWGMFSEYQNGILIHHLDFVGRLYLVPVSLMLFLLALERRTAVMALLLIPILYGGYLTWQDHARFQRTYKGIYQASERIAEKPVFVYYPPKTLSDNVRGIRIGDFKDAAIRVEPRSGELHFSREVQRQVMPREECSPARAR